MRMWLEHDDLVRVRFTTEVNPFSEALISVQSMGTAVPATPACVLNFGRHVAPDWPVLTRLVQVDVAHRAQRLATDGLGAVLNTLHRAIRWEAPVLTIRTGWQEDPHGTDVHLRGRGITLAPWPMAGRFPRVLVADGQPAFVMYPIFADAAVAPGAALETLIGRTRAAALRHLAAPGRHTTGELAAHLGVSAASASEHATALRDTGLVGTVRAGRGVWHSVTPLGLQLLGSADAVPGRSSTARAAC